jgi:hypothetical protein
LPEYAAAEAAFIGTALAALSKARGGILGLIGSERTSRVGTTQVTLDSGEVVEFESGAIKTSMALHNDDIIASNVGALLTTIDAAAEVHHDEMTKWVLGNLEKLTTATGNKIDASGRPLFDAVYEMFEKIDLSFEEDGRISEGFAWVMHPDMVEKIKRMEAEMTDEQRKQLDSLIDKKREEFFARRRRRQLP